MGLVISDGITIADDGNPEHPMFVVWKDGTVEICHRIDPAKKGDIWLAHTGFGITMKDGVDTDGGGYEKPLMPRMTYGLTQNRRYLLLVTVDGRQKQWSLGATGAEVRQIMRAAGAWDVIDMDGGGSATLCYWDEEHQKPVMVNRHNDSGYARPVGTNLGIYLKSVDAKPSAAEQDVKNDK
jgi:exopolysaccharide biosynthesis protein